MNEKNSPSKGTGIGLADNRCRLYLVTPSLFDPLSFSDLLASALDADDVACVQMRLKNVDDDTVRRAIDILRPVAQSRNVAFLLNDRVDLAVASGCDGVHLGQEDGDHEAARKLLGTNILGVTCHDSRHLGMRAGELGADYVAFGSFFSTTTKNVAHYAELELLEWWSTIMELPSVAIGGITAANCSSLVQAGANFLAVMGAVWNHPSGPAAGVQSMNAAINDAG